MEIHYANSKIEKQCTSLKEAEKLFGGNKALATSLLSRINAIERADVIKDIILMPPFHFHDLRGKLDDNKEPFNPCNIDEVASVVRIVEIREVSAHYE